MTETNMLSMVTLRELASAGAITGIRLVARTDGFAIYIRCGSTEKTLRAKRGHIRCFKSLDRAVAFVQVLGISRMEVDVSGLEMDQKQ